MCSTAISIACFNLFLASFERPVAFRLRVQEKAPFWSLFLYQSAAKPPPLFTGDTPETPAASGRAAEAAFQR